MSLQPGPPLGKRTASRLYRPIGQIPGLRPPIRTRRGSSDRTTEVKCSRTKRPQPDVPAAGPGAHAPDRRPLGRKSERTAQGPRAQRKQRPAKGAIPNAASGHIDWTFPKGLARDRPRKQDDAKRQSSSRTGPHRPGLQGLKERPTRFLSEAAPTAQKPKRRGESRAGDSGPRKGPRCATATAHGGAARTKSDSGNGAEGESFENSAPQPVQDSIQRLAGNPGGPFLFISQPLTGGHDELPGIPDKYRHRSQEDNPSSSQEKTAGPS